MMFPDYSNIKFTGETRPARFWTGLGRYRAVIVIFWRGLLAENVVFVSTTGHNWGGRAGERSKNLIRARHLSLINWHWLLTSTLVWQLRWHNNEINYNRRLYHYNQVLTFSIQPPALYNHLKFLPVSQSLLRLQRNGGHCSNCLTEFPR